MPVVLSEVHVGAQVFSGTREVDGRWVTTFHVRRHPIVLSCNDATSPSGSQTEGTDSQAEDIERCNDTCGTNSDASEDEDQVKDRTRKEVEGTAGKVVMDQPGGLTIDTTGGLAVDSDGDLVLPRPRGRVPSQGIHAPVGASGGAAGRTPQPDGKTHREAGVSSHFAGIHTREGTGLDVMIVNEDLDSHSVAKKPRLNSKEADGLPRGISRQRRGLSVAKSSHEAKDGSMLVKGCLRTQGGDDVEEWEPQGKAADEAVTIWHAMATELDDVGLQVWNGSLLLADFVLHHSAHCPGSDARVLFPRGIKVLELGAGTGLVGLMLAKVAARVYLTDIGIDVVENCRRNVDGWYQRQEHGQGQGDERGQPAGTEDSLRYWHPRGSPSAEKGPGQARGQAAREDDRSLGQGLLSGVVHGGPSREMELGKGELKHPMANTLNNKVTKSGELLPCNAGDDRLPTRVARVRWLDWLACGAAAGAPDRASSVTSASSEGPPGGAPPGEYLFKWLGDPGGGGGEAFIWSAEEVCFVALEKRFNFAINDSDAHAHAFEHFLSFLGDVTPTPANAGDRDPAEEISAETNQVHLSPQGPVRARSVVACGSLMASGICGGSTGERHIKFDPLLPGTQHSVEGKQEELASKPGNGCMPSGGPVPCAANMALFPVHAGTRSCAGECTLPQRDAAQCKVTTSDVPEHDGLSSASPHTGVEHRSLSGGGLPVGMAADRVMDTAPGSIRLPTTTLCDGAPWGLRTPVTLQETERSSACDSGGISRGLEVHDQLCTSDAAGVGHTRRFVGARWDVSRLPSYVHCNGTGRQLCHMELWQISLRF
eukprot:jgi/Mesvir1/24424/Mv11083-RA.2